MKLAFGGSGFFIEFEENRIETLIIEHPGCFRDVLMEIMRQCDGRDGKLILSENDNIIEFSKNAVLISDPMNLERNTRKIISRFHKQLSMYVSESSLYHKFQELTAELECFVCELEEISEYTIQYDTMITIEKLLKFMDVKLMEADQPYPEALSDYLKLLAELLDVKLIIISHLRSYLNNEELIQLYEMLNYWKIPVLLLENRESEMLEYEHRYIVDSDMCII